MMTIMIVGAVTIYVLVGTVIGAVSAWRLKEDPVAWGWGCAIMWPLVGPILLIAILSRYMVNCLSAREKRQTIPKARVVK